MVDIGDADVGAVFKGGQAWHGILPWVTVASTAILVSHTFTNCHLL